MPSRPAFRDASSDAPAHVHFPEVIAAFEDMRFRRLGRLERVFLGGLDQVTSIYPAEVRAVFRENKSVPMTVLVSGEGSALVLVDWLWGMPDVRIRTSMLDGSVVETRRAWDSPVVLPRALERMRERLNMAEEQVISSVPNGGRTIALVTGTPKDLWTAHERRVASWGQQRATRPAAIEDMEQAATLSERLSAHDFRVINRVRLIQFSLFALLFALPVIALGRILLAGPMSLAAVVAIFTGMLLWLLLTSIVCPRLPRIRYVQGVRPRFVKQVSRAVTGWG